MNDKSNSFMYDCFFNSVVELMKTKPYKEITIKDICEKSGFSRMAYYRNFESKDDILIKKVEAVYDRLKVLVKENIGKTYDIEIFREIYNEFLNNHLISTLFKARLMEYFVYTNRDLIIFFYKDIYNLDVNDPEVKQKIYDALGISISTMLYLVVEDKIFTYNEIIRKIKKFMV